MKTRLSLTALTLIAAAAVGGQALAAKPAPKAKSEPAAASAPAKAEHHKMKRHHGKTPATAPAAKAQ